MGHHDQCLRHVNAMTDIDYFTFLIIALPLLIGADSYYQYRSRYRRHPTFEEYRSRHPGLVTRGRVECHSCGGSLLHVRGLRNAVDTRKTHYCTTCGKPLYRSKA